MCGRTACTLDQREIKRATRQYSKNKDDLQWIQKYDWQNYNSSYNFSPTQIGPVIVNRTTFEEKVDDHALTLMRWGFIPSWYRGTIQECFLKTNNCRHESILEKPTFKGAAAAGRRCIVLADGFYEWKEIGNKKKQPYFIYFPQEDGEDVFTRNKDNLLNEKEWKGPRLLTMAGLFDVWKSPQKETYYSYSIITLDSSKTMSFVHSRMPAILNGADEVSMWLDTNRVSTKEAISILKPVEDLQMHPVSTVVGNSRNNSIECIKPYREPEKKKSTALTSWLIKGNSKDLPSKRFKPNSQE